MDLLVVAKISGTHHLKGAVKVLSNVDELDIVIGNKVIVELGNGSTKVLTMKEASPLVGKKWAVEFEEITNKTEASLLQGGLIKVRRDILDIEEDEYLVNDVIGMKVYEENGDYLGEVQDIFETAAHDIFVVESEEFETMIPDIDVFVKDVNFDKHEMRVSLIEGMKEKKK